MRDASSAAFSHLPILSALIRVACPEPACPEPVKGVEGSAGNSERVPNFNRRSYLSEVGS